MSFIIQLNGVGKIYHENWILKEVNLTLQSNIGYHINGSNGSGKSTLSKIINGYVQPSIGEVIWLQNNVSIDKDEWYQYFSWAAPYTQLFESYTLEEHFNFFSAQKAMLVSNATAFAETIGLSSNLHQKINTFSSGMLQRVKLGFAILSKSQVLMLDEPTSNLDEKAIQWFQNLLGEHLKDRILLVASNNKSAETSFCSNKIEIETYKKA